MTGTIFNIQKFCINDGPGIRTTVFVKGCPLDCLWCHNPESKSTKPEIMYNAGKCVGCGRCVSACPLGLHTLSEEGHAFDRTRCISCGKCSDACYAGALELSGYTVTVEEVIAEVMKDECFYRNSGGGMTVSGGEPLAQFEFTYELLRAAKERGLHTCMETSGFTSASRIERIAPLVDLFLFDYKITDSALHKKYTGVANDGIRENLRRIDALGAKSCLRCPIIPTINDNEAHFASIAEMANSLSHIEEIHIEPYHPLGSGKSEMLGRDYPLTGLTFPEEETVAGWIAEIAAKTSVPVRKA